MFLTELGVVNFRNALGGVECGTSLNILLGDNGQGKTNWLESIYLLATTRSFRTSRLSEAIRFDEASAGVVGKVRRSADISRELRVALEGNTKAFSVNGKRESVQRYLGQLHAIIFNADELEVIRGTPDTRRRFLDESITAIHPPYIQTISDLSRVIKQKNALLQSARDDAWPKEKTVAALTPWNQQFTQIAGKVHRSRLRIVERLNEVLARGLFGSESVSIRYASSLEGKGPLDAYDDLLSERLELRLDAEIAAGYTLIGPHRDDLEILLEGRDIRKFGSSGQQRSALLLLLLANLELYFAQREEYPLFLIDDIDAELDFRRIGQLLEYLEGRTQTFVTTSKESFLTEFGSRAKLHRVINGAVSQSPLSAQGGG